MKTTLAKTGIGMNIGEYSLRKYQLRTYYNLNRSIKVTTCRSELKLLLNVRTVSSKSVQMYPEERT